MTRDEYERHICARTLVASTVRFVPDTWDGGMKPKSGECHQNVDSWVAHHPGHTAVRGWIFWYGGGEDLAVYTAHSVVRDLDGELFDITPLENGDHRRGPFIPHLDDDESLFAMKTQNLSITCQGKFPLPPNNSLSASQQLEVWPEGSQ